VNEARDGAVPVRLPVAHDAGAQAHEEVMEERRTGLGPPPGEPDGLQPEFGPGPLASALRYKWVVLALVIVAATLGVLFAMSQPVEYEASAELLLTDPRNAGVFRERQFADQTRYVRNQAQRISSTAVAEEAAALLEGQYDVEEIQKNLSVDPAEDLDLITITAVGGTALEAARQANAVAQAYQNVVTAEVRSQADEAIAELDLTTADLRRRVALLEAQLVESPESGVIQAERDALLSQLIQLESRADQIAVDAALFGSGVEVFEGARLPERPVRPRPVQTGGLAGVGGLLLGVVLAWLLANRQRRADTAQDPAKVFDAPLLGEIPDFRSAGLPDDVPAGLHPGSAAAQAYEFTLASLQHAAQQHNRPMVLVTSAMPGEGKTVTVLNLATVAARDGQPLLAVDADIRSRGLSKRFGIDEAPGIESVASGDVPFKHAIMEYEIAAGVRVPVLPAGPRDKVHPGFYRTPAFTAAVKRLRSGHAMTIFDSPPLLAVADASLIASRVDGIVLVVARGTPLETLRSVRYRLEFVGVPLLGYIFNRSQSRKDGYGYGYAEEGAGRHTAPRAGLLRRRKPTRWVA
jgi:Mrp family chromosome partitioning ATPase